jgi:hypothetical protein
MVFSSGWVCGLWPAFGAGQFGAEQSATEVAKGVDVAARQEPMLARSAAGAQQTE